MCRTGFSMRRDGVRSIIPFSEVTTISFISLRHRSRSIPVSWKKSRARGILEEKPSKGECWEYRFKDGQLRYVLQLRDDGDPYRGYFAVIPEGFAEFHCTDEGEYQYYVFYLTMEKGKRYLFFNVSRLDSRFPKELQFEIATEIMEIYPDPDQKGFELYTKEDNTYKHIHGYLYSQKSYLLDYCDSKFVNVDRCRKFFGSLGKESAEWAEEVLKGVLRNGFQPI